MLKLRIKKKPVPAPPAPKKETSPSRNLDGVAKLSISGSRNLLVPWYLMTSYLYYVHDISIISDELYDRICVELDHHFDTVDHWHKDLIDRDALKAGTGYSLDFKSFPARIVGGATHLARGDVRLSVKRGG